MKSEVGGILFAAAGTEKLVDMPDVTRLLDAAAAGDRRAAADLLPLLYDQLRKLAAAKMAGKSPDHTFDATALGRDAYLRLDSEAPTACSNGSWPAIRACPRNANCTPTA
jgi:hypothetical protein